MEKMGSNGWGTKTPLIDSLFKEGYKFDFYQAVRLLEFIFADKIPVGDSSEPEKEVVRFKSNVDFVFPSSDIFDIKKSSLDDGGPCEMLINFISLAGAFGPLPDPYTELIVDRCFHRDFALKDFLDIFNHRLASLMYRVKKIYSIGFELNSPNRTHFASYLYSLIGIGTPYLKNRMSIEDRCLLHYSSIFCQGPKSMRGLEIILSDYFNIPVKGEYLKGQWDFIADDQITKLGNSGQNRSLGSNTVIGTKIWDQQGKFQLIIGPVTFDKYLDFLPKGEANKKLYQLIRFYAGIELEFDVFLIIKNTDIPDTHISSSKGLNNPMLGWTSWLKSAKQKVDTKLKGDFKVQIKYMV
ncbi:MAG: type VI secretion system baseplate subunit TssG [Desulfobacterales bacterium]|nr:type VI secretion system baseplate subunit TssG [Desulfobacterales bacterium]